MLLIFGCDIEVWMFVVGPSAGVFGLHSMWYFLALGNELFLNNNDCIHYVILQG